MSVPVSCPHPAADAACPKDGDASSGQVLIMFAIFLTGLLGAVGLSTDLGVACMQRRTVQAAADAGALAGTRIVARQSGTSQSARADVEAVVLANMSALGSVSSINCSYVNDAGQAISDCSRSIPSGASGVRVSVTESHPTFFVRVIPGAPTSVATSASARANVKTLGMPTDGPFLPCGVDTRLASGGRLSLAVKSDGLWIINPAAVGSTFEIHGPQIEKCDAKASRYKGLADVDANRDRSAPGWFVYKEGDSAGMISQDVEGPDGCKAGQEIVDCVVFLPVVVNDPAESGNDRQLWTIGFAPFYVTAPKSNEHWGKLISDYLVFGRGQSGNWGWTPDFEGPITIRLTE